MDELKVLTSVFGVLLAFVFIACVTIIPWGIGIAHMWGSIFG